MKSKIPFSGNRAKNTAKTQPPSPRARIIIFLDHAKRGRPKGIARRPGIRAFAVYDHTCVITNTGK